MIIGSLTLLLALGTLFLLFGCYVQLSPENFCFMLCTLLCPIGYCFLAAYYFLIRDRKGVAVGGRRYLQELGEVKGKKNCNHDILYKKNLF